MFDSHNHTNCSFDSNCKIDDLCAAAIKKGIEGIVISDHCDIEYYKEDNIYENIKKSFNDSLAAKEKYKGKLKVLAGVEIGDMMWDKNAFEEIMGSFDFDTVINSVHLVRFKGEDISFSSSDFTFNEAKESLKIYFDDLLTTAQEMRGDILAHITYPYRYFNGKWKFNLCWDEHIDKIEEILKTIIRRNIALEINSSGIGGPVNDFMPNKEITMLYKNLGGEFVTIGSDSHAAERVGNGVREAEKMLKECGFKSYFYYERRKPYKIDL